MLKLVSLFAMMLLLTTTSVWGSILPGGEENPQANVVKTVDRSELISFAKKYLGTRYHTAGSSPKKGFDCSGFVNFVFGNFKIRLPRSSREFKDIGTDLKPEEFKKGDIIVFYGFKNKNRIGHVGIICEANGMQSKFIHSSSGKKMGVVVSNLGSPNYSKRFYRCVDVIGSR
jgi:cell wall-associated NlpC family hydrolase